VRTDSTVIGKPFNGQGGSGTRLHVSVNREARNAFDAPGEEDGVS
jgi:glutamine synthetase